MNKLLHAYSLRRRLLIWLLVPLLIIGVVALLDAYRSARAIADEISDRVLAGSALAIAERVFVNEKGELDVDIPYVALEMLTSAADDRVFYRVGGAGAEFVTGYRQLQLPKAFERQERSTMFANAVFRGTPIRIAVYEAGASSNSHSLTFRVAVAETTNARNKMANDILLRSALRQLILITTAAIVVWFAVTRALRPLHRLQEAVGRRSSNDLRPIEHRVPTEVAGLVNTINALLVRFDGSLSALRNFTSNASHQLRTPLTVVRTQLALANRASSLRLMAKAIAEADLAIGDAELVISKLMVLAKIDAAHASDLTAQQTDIADLSQQVCKEFLTQASQMKIDLGYEGPDRLNVLGDAILMREMLRNLVQNAIVHGGSSIDITVRAGEDNGTPFVQVEDNGAGLSDHNKSRVIERFSRADSSGDAGTGVGLAIAREIAVLCGGNLTLHDTPSGSGLMVHIDLLRGH